MHIARNAKRGFTMPCVSYEQSRGEGQCPSKIFGKLFWSETQVTTCTYQSQHSCMTQAQRHSTDSEIGDTFYGWCDWTSGFLELSIRLFEHGWFWCIPSPDFCVVQNTLVLFPFFNWLTYALQLGQIMSYPGCNEQTDCDARQLLVARGCPRNRCQQSYVVWFGVLHTAHIISLQ